MFRIVKDIKSYQEGYRDGWDARQEKARLGLRRRLLKLGAVRLPERRATPKSKAQADRMSERVARVFVKEGATLSMPALWKEARMLHKATGLLPTEGEMKAWVLKTAERIDRATDTRGIQEARFKEQIKKMVRR